MPRVSDGHARWVWVLAATFALAISSDLLRMPVQVYDSLGELLDAQASPSAWHSFVGATGAQAYFRPLRIAQIKLLFDVADGHYWLVYRGWHALLLCAAFALFARSLRVASRDEWAAAAFALLVFMGTHTFSGLVREAFPINHFLEIVVACLVALNLAQSRATWAVDGLALAVFACAALTLESGVLVWVVFLCARLQGARAASWRGVAAMTMALAGYLAVRFYLLDVGTPDLSERSSGFGLEMLNPAELEDRFGQRPLLFYTYNVATSLLSVFLGEPQNGVFVAVRDSMGGSVPARVFLGVAAAIPTTVLIVWAAGHTWRQGQLSSRMGRLLVVSLAVIAANAVLSYAYSKNEILTVAGTFYALAAFAAIVVALERCRTCGRGARAAIIAVLLLSGTAWAIKSAGIHYLLSRQAARHRFDWAVLPVVSPQIGAERTDPKSLALIRSLRESAVHTPIPGPRDHLQWMENLWAD
jgi:hypothetical protein